MPRHRDCCAGAARAWAERWCLRCGGAARCRVSIARGVAPFHLSGEEEREMSRSPFGGGPEPHHRNAELRGDIDGRRLLVLLDYENLGLEVGEVEFELVAFVGVVKWGCGGTGSNPERASGHRRAIVQNDSNAVAAPDTMTVENRHRRIDQRPERLEAERFLVEGFERVLLIVAHIK